MRLCGRYSHNVVPHPSPQGEAAHPSLSKNEYSHHNFEGMAKILERSGGADVSFSHLFSEERNV
jgi:hypothetical protein